MNKSLAILIAAVMIRNIKIYGKSSESGNADFFKPAG